MNRDWECFVEAVKERKIVCYGAGVNALLMLADVHFRPFLEKVCYFVDKDFRKHGKKLTVDTVSYDIFSIEKLEEDSDCVILVTLTDYLSVGKMLEERGFRWFPWTVISTDFIFNTLKIERTQNQPAIFLLNTPDYMNLGDQAIAYAEDIYLRENFGEYYEFGTHSCHPSALNRLQKFIKPEDVILMQGGGNMGSLWRVCEEILRDVIKKFPENSIIVFPQSIYYGDTEEEKAYFSESQKIYNSHKNLLICTRDQRSYEFVKKAYHCDCMLLPDMVLTLQNKAVAERKKVGVLLRSDKEQRLPNDYEKTVDTVLKILGQKKKSLTHHPVDSVSNRISRVNKILKEYASCKLIITDRLHGMIFAAITNTPCIAFDNSYHKVSGVYETWLKEYESITVSQPLSEGELLKIVAEKLNLQEGAFDFLKFQECFALLTKYIKNL